MTEKRGTYGGWVLELVAPTPQLREALVQAVAEWGPGAHEDGFGLDPALEVRTPVAFKVWLARLQAESDPAEPRRVTFRWIVDDGLVHGGIALRHGTDEVTAEIGHIGYGIRPSSRRRGRGTWALARMLDIAREAGMDRVLLVCDVDNFAAVCTIERNGGVLEGIRDTVHGTARRYWINLDDSNDGGWPRPAKSVDPLFKREKVVVDGCKPCMLSGPGGVLYATKAWRVEHCIGPLGVETFVVKPIRHVTGLADLTADEAGELRPLLRVAYEVARRLTPCEQVYCCLWSHSRGVPGHAHFVVQPVTAGQREAAGCWGPLCSCNVPGRSIPGC